MPIMFRLRIALAATVVLLGCEVERPLRWTYEIPAAVEAPGSVLHARIRRGGCNYGDEIIYEIRPRDTEMETIPVPVLREDRDYCFEVALEDMTCATYARSTMLVRVNGDEESPSVHNVLAVEPSPRACDGPCDAALGCVSCEEGEVFCPEDAGGGARCCASLLGCDQPAAACELL